MQQTTGVVAGQESCTSARPTELTVLHVTAPAAAGGLETVVLALAGGLRDRGHDIHVAAIVTPDQSDTPLLARLRSVGVAVHPAVLPARAYQRERAFVADLCRKLQPDVVHTHGYRTDVIDGVVARRLHLPAVSTVHGFTYTGVRGSVYEWAQRRALRRFDAVVAVSRPQVDQLVRAGVHARRVHLIRNAAVFAESDRRGRADERHAIMSDGRFNVGWVGRLSHEKGADLLIDALADLRDLPIVVSLIGEGRHRAALEARAARRGIGDRIRWHGLVLDVHRHFADFDVFVLSSRTEGTPMVLFEAIAAGVPIVATAVGGVPDVVSDSEAALVPPAAPALAAAIRRTYEDPQGAATRARAARARMDREFCLQPWLARYEELYRSIHRPRFASRPVS